MPQLPIVRSRTTNPSALVPGGSLAILSHLAESSPALIFAHLTHVVLMLYANLVMMVVAQINLFVPVPVDTEVILWSDAQEEIVRQILIVEAVKVVTISIVRILAVEVPVLPMQNVKSGTMLLSAVVLMGIMGTP